MENIITHIITANDLNDDRYVGKYDISMHGSKLIYEQKEYEYISSGLCREVFISECGTYVLKAPYYDMLHDLNEYEEIMEYIKGDGFSNLPYAIKHNILEYEAYRLAPKNIKKYLAKTKLLSNGWVKQEFVNVKPIKGFSHKLREIGITLNNQTVIFDYDPFF